MPDESLTAQWFETWQTDALRVTAFPEPAATIESAEWWSTLVGAPPETKISHPRQLIYREEGPFSSGKMGLHLEPTRIDWRFTLPDEPKEEVGGIPTLGAFYRLLGDFQAFIERWFAMETCPSMQRLAFGAIIWQPIQTRQEGYQRLAQYLRQWVKIDEEHSSDLLYRINRPRQCTANIDDLMVNRLSTWAVRRSAAFLLSQNRAAIVEDSIAYSCQLELDINTSPQFRGVFPGEMCAAIFQELVVLGSEIAREGDIP